jgi:1,5-anhydro-D-fructose reductase (1,5-anhydro-D-mannitol-forming)
MAMNSVEAETMIGACRRHGVRLMVGHMIRFSPLVHKIRSIVRSGVLGTITFARAEFMYDSRSSTRDWLYDRRRAGGGPVFDIGVHCLDTLRYVLEDEVTDVRATLNPSPTDDRVEHTAQLALRLSRGTIGAIFCSYAAPFRRRFLEIIGTDGYLSAPDFTISKISVPLTVVLGPETGHSTTTTEHIVVPNLYVAEIEHFVTCITTNAEPESGGENGLANQRVLDVAMQ